jgi:3-hydroxyisobutyrate dehydrogenase
MKIAFIGLGHMGFPMAQNLVKKGHQVYGFDLVADSLHSFAQKGGIACSSSLEASQQAEITLTMLPEGRHVESVYLGQEGLLTSIHSPHFFIDCSTIDVLTARRVHDEAKKRGHLFLDAPVSGGVGGAEKGTLTFMVGGEKSYFDHALPLFEAMGKNIFHAGAPGNGQAAKICNNLMLAVHMIVTSEAFCLAEKLGLDSQKLFDIASTSSGQSWSLTSYCPVPGPVPTSPANRGYEAGFTASMMLKDIRLALSAAHSTGSLLPLGEKAENLYDIFCKEGYAQKDFSGIILALKK